MTIFHILSPGFARKVIQQCRMQGTCFSRHLQWLHGTWRAIEPVSLHGRVLSDKVIIPSYAPTNADRSHRAPGACHCFPYIYIQIRMQCAYKLQFSFASSATGLRVSQNYEFGSRECRIFVVLVNHPVPTRLTQSYTYGTNGRQQTRCILGRDYVASPL